MHEVKALGAAQLSVNTGLSYIRYDKILFNTGTTKNKITLPQRAIYSHDSVSMKCILIYEVMYKMKINANCETDKTS